MKEIQLNLVDKTSLPDELDDEMFLVAYFGYALGTWEEMIYSFPLELKQGV